MTELSDPRVPGGGAGKQVSLGGAETRNGIAAGLVVAEISAASAADLKDRVLYFTDTLDMTDGAAFFDIPNAIDYRSIDIDLTGGSGGTISIIGDLTEAQATFAGSIIAFRPIIQTDNFATATTALATNTYQRGKLAYTAFRVYVASTGTGTRTVTMILKG